MMTSKSFCKRLSSLIFIGLCIIAGYNICNDGTGILNRYISGYIQEPTLHFVKVRYIINNPSKYNAFAFGTSRVGNIDLTKCNEDGIKFYNMYYSEGLPKEWLDDIKIMLKHGVHIKKLLIAMDDVSFRVDPEIHKTQLMRLPYEDNIFSQFHLYVSLLFDKFRDWEYYKADESTGSIYDIYDTGRIFHDYPDCLIEQDVVKHINDKKFNIPTHYEGNRIAVTLEQIREIKEICDKNNIEVIFFIHPIHKTTYLDTNFEEFNTFKKGLAEIVDYIDFSNFNDITTNNYYYYETSHYRPLVGDMIIKKIFNDDGTLPENFGIKVTNENIDNHIAFLKKNRNEYILNISR